MQNSAFEGNKHLVQLFCKNVGSDNLDIFAYYYTMIAKCSTLSQLLKSIIEMLSFSINSQTVIKMLW